MSGGISATTVAMMAATSISAYSAVQSGKAQQQAANYQAQVAANNAKIASYNANSAIDEGNQKLQAAQQQAAQQQGTIRAVMGAGGIDLNSGSALRNQQGLAQVTALDQATITSNAARTAWNYRNQGNDFTAQAGLDKMKGEQANTAGWLNGFSSLVGSAGQFKDKF